jgi:cyclic pyranopterin phosphate synthase
MARKLRLLHAAPKLWNYVKYRCLPREAATSVRRYSPQIAMLVVTKRCNLNCNHCNTAQLLKQSGGNWRDSEATLEKVMRIFANPLLANCLLVDLFGGEPLLVEELDRIVDYLSRHGHMTNTATNGLLLADRIKDLKKAGISRINVSLYEANRAVLERDLAGINRVFPTNASLLLLRSAVETHPEKLMETVHFAREAGCLGLRFWIYRPMGLNPQPSEIIHDADAAYREFQRRIEAAFPGFCLWPAAIRIGPVRKLCPQLWQRISCDVLGGMQMCCSDFTPGGAFSNLFDDAPDIVFNRPVVVAMREQLMDPRREPPAMFKTCNLLGDPGW